jgi:hypothetical protein
VSRGIVPGVLIALFALARAQTSAPAKAANGPRLAAHDSVTVSAGIPKDVLRKETEYDKVFQAAMESKEDDEYEAALAKFQSAEKIARNLAGSIGRPAHRQFETRPANPRRHEKWRASRRTGGGSRDFDTSPALCGSRENFLRRVDILRAWAGEFDNAFAHNYEEAAAVPMIQQHGHRSQGYCLQAINAYDKAIEGLVATSDPSRLDSARRAKALDMYYLGLIYYRERKYVESLQNPGSGILHRCGTPCPEGIAPAHGNGSAQHRDRNPSLDGGHQVGVSRAIRSRTRIEG